MEERQDELAARRRAMPIGYYANKKRENAIMDLSNALRAAEELYKHTNDPKLKLLAAETIKQIQAAIIELKDQPAEAARDRKAKARNK